jgi:hypothetical protein
MTAEPMVESLDSIEPAPQSPTTRVWTVELGESGPGTDSDVRFLGAFSAFDKALAFCRGEGRPYLEHPQAGAINAFVVTEMGLDSLARYRTHYVAYDGSLHQEWPYEGVGAEAQLRSPSAGDGLEL